VSGTNPRYQLRYAPTIGWTAAKSEAKPEGFSGTANLPAAQKQDKATSPARNPVEGAKIFRYYCAACHGADGRGHGPASVALKHRVSDLTLISQRNGGKFPYQRVKEIIERERTWTARPRRSGDANFGDQSSMRSNRTKTGEK
jgi:mono/diheme cytochrome c family protein